MRKADLPTIYLRCLGGRAVLILRCRALYLFSLSLSPPVTLSCTLVPRLASRPAGRRSASCKKIGADVNKPEADWRFVAVGWARHDPDRRARIKNRRASKNPASGRFVGSASIFTCIVPACLRWLLKPWLLKPTMAAGRVLHVQARFVLFPFQQVTLGLRSVPPRVTSYHGPGDLDHKFVDGKGGP